MEYTVDLSGVTDRPSLHEAIAAILPLPAYYGKNLDALYDVLTETHESWSVRFTGSTRAKEQLGAYFDNLVATFADARADGSPVVAVWC